MGFHLVFLNGGSQQTAAVSEDNSEALQTAEQHDAQLLHPDKL